MPVQRWLSEIVARIAANAKPLKIVLFGSRARGRPGRDSDIDLFVLMDRPRSRNRRYDLVDKAVGPHIWPLDILVRSSKEVEERLSIGDDFIADILKVGKVLYES